MTVQEQRKSDAIRFVNTIVKAKKMLLKHYQSLEDVDIYGIGLGSYNYVSDDATCVQMRGIFKLAKLLGVDTEEVEWSGNEGCHANYMEVYFVYKGIKFFELIDKIDVVINKYDVKYLEENTDVEGK